MIKGQRMDLDQLALAGRPASVSFRVNGGLALDMVCLGLGADGKIPDDRYVIFFNQTASPCGGISLLSLTSGEHGVLISPEKVPTSIHRIVVAVAVDGQGQFSPMSSGSLRIGAVGGTQGEFTLQNSELGRSDGVILAELYLRHGKWRFFVRAEGYSGGLDWFLRQHGVSPS
jgi:tellurite resistance protein TerA